ncbi:MAG: ATP-binding protein [Acidimicrobiia bacterium]|nr:ATP-binding protein [Acidimicrobiia bacterium]
MTEPDPVLDALLAALATNDHPDLRTALGRHLSERHRFGDALPHLREALHARPADVELLTLAAAAADHVGEAETAAGYRRLLTALDPGNPGRATDPSTGPSEHRPPDLGSDGPPLHPSMLGSDDDPVAPLDPPPGAKPAPVTATGDDDGFDSFLREVLAEDRATRVRLSDVGGMSQVKAELERRFFLPLRNPEIQRAYGKSVSGGLLLYGPPGCGKTFLARAIAGELDARFVPVTLHDTLDMWLGKSEQNLHAVFTEARADTPTVLFLDEVDAIGQKRSRAASASMRGVVAQLLNELDGAVDRNDGIFVVAATNAPWDVDPALRRPGRFDRTVLVLPPDSEARRAILELHLRDRPTEGLDLDKLAGKTRNLSGADLKLICDTAVELAMERSVTSGRVEPITQKLLERAAKPVKPSVRPWLETARNFVTFANHDGEYDELELYLASQGR